MGDFAENFIQGFMAGHRAKSEKERTAQDKERFEESKKQHAEEFDLLKRTREAELKAHETANQFDLLDHLSKSPGSFTPVDTDKTGSMNEDMIGTGERAQEPDMNIMGHNFPVMRLEDTVKQKLMMSAQEAKIKDEAENVPLASDLTQIGLKAGTKIRPPELAAKVALFGDESQVKAAGIRASAAAAAKAGGEVDGDYLGQQIVDRRIDYRSLTKDQKTAATTWLKDQGLDIPRALSAKEKDAGNSSISGLGALDKMDALLAADPNLPYKESLNPSGLLGAPARSLVPNLSEYSAAKREAVDVVTRIRTGAALNKEEEKFYPQQVAQSGDSPEVVKAKHNQLRAFYLGVAGVPVRLTSPDGKQRVLYQDLYDAKQRLGTRKRIAQGWRLEY